MKNDENIEKHYFGKIHSEYLLNYLVGFFDLSDIKTLYVLSKQFVNILKKDNHKIIHEIQEKIFGSESQNELIINKSSITNYTLSNYIINRFPIVNSIIADKYLISTACTFEDGFSIYDIENKKMHEKVLFNPRQYSYVFSLLFLKKQKILIVGCNNGYIIGYYIHEKKFINFWNYKTGFNKEIKKLSECNEDNYFLSLDINESAFLNFIRVFSVSMSNITNKFKIDYIRSYIIRDCVIYNIKCFSNYFVYCFYEYNREIYKNYNFYQVENNNSFSNQINDNYLGILLLKDTILNKDSNLTINDTYKELKYNFLLKGHKSNITDFIYIKEKNYILSVEFLSPLLFIWNLETKTKINTISLPHKDSILSLLNISNSVIFSAGRDKKIYSYNLNDIFSYKNTTGSIKYNEINCNHSRDIYNLHYYQNNDNNIKLISCSFDKTIKMFNLSKNLNSITSKIILTGHSTSIICLKVDYLRKELITIDIDSVINIWEYNEIEKCFVIKKSIELNIINPKSKVKKEFIDDIISMHDYLNSITIINKTNKIKIYSLLKENFIFEFEEKDGKIQKIIDCCNCSTFVCYISNNTIKVFNYDIRLNIINIKEFHCIIPNIDIINCKISCMKLLSLKYKLTGCGFSNGNIILISYNHLLKSNQYNQTVININSFLQDKNIHNIEIKNIKCIENDDEILYIIFTVNNLFFIYSFDIKDKNANFINLIEFGNDFVNIEVLNKKLVISSFLHASYLEFVYLPKYLGIIKEGNKINEDDCDWEENNNELNIMQISSENVNGIVYVRNKKGVVFLSNDSIKYIEYNEIY